MQILTPNGYIPIESAKPGTPLLAYDVNTGEEITNTLIDIKYMNKYDEGGNIDPFFDSNGFYIINGKYTLYKDQSIWVSKGGHDVAYHINELSVGDLIYDDYNGDVIIETIEQTSKDGWWKLHVSGDASYIIYDMGGITLHNASRFWVGGTGTWSSADTTKWSATSGGASGSSVPGTADTATFDALSGGGTVTLNYAPTLGGLTGGAHTGTFDTGNQTITFSAGRLDWSGTGVRTLTLGSSTINGVGQSTGGWNIATTTNLTFNAGTSTIANTIGANASFQGGGLTYYNVTTSAVGGGAGTITGSNTFNNLTINAVSNTGRLVLDFNTTQTVTGTFTCTGQSASVFGMITVRGTGTNTYAGITATINAANVSLSNIVIKGLIGTGAGSWTGTNIGNGGDCTGITFTTPVTRYWVGGTGSFASTANWSTSTGGAGGSSVPLPQDTIVFDSNSCTTSGRVITFNHCAYPTIDFTNITNNPTITFTSTNGGLYFFGDIIMGSNVTSNGANGFIIYGSGPQNINLQGHTLMTTATTQLSMVGTSLLFTGDYTGNASVNGTIQLISGTLNFNGYNVTIGIISNSTQNITRSLIQGNGQITLTGSGTTIWSFGTITGFTFTKGTKPIICNYSGSTGTRTISQGSFGGTFGKSSYPDFNITAGSDIISCSISRVGSFDFTGFSGTLNNETRVVFGDFTLSPTMTVTAGANRTTFGAETSDSQTITSNGKTMDFPVTIGVSGTGLGSVSLGDAMVIGATRDITQTNGTFTTNNKSLSTGILKSTGSNVRTLTLGSSTVTLTGTGSVLDFSTKTNLTFNCGTSTIIVNDGTATAKTFAGNTMVFYNLTVSGDNVTISGNNTFNQINNNTSGLTNGLIFTSGTTQTLTGSVGMTSNGVAGLLSKISSSVAGTPATLSKASGYVSVDYMSIKDSTATGGAGWFAGSNSTNVSGNTGWIFTPPPPSAQEAFMDQNFVRTLLAVASYNGTTILNLIADPVTHALLVSDGTGGTDNGGGQVAARDNNRDTVILAVSNADGSTIVQPYADYTNKYLMINSN